MDDKASASLPSPPAELDAPNAVELVQGALLHRIHSGSLLGTAFNPCEGSPTRFAPIHDEHGSCVPSLYAGDTLEAAIYETVFHDVPLNARRKTVPISAVADRKHSILLVGRTLRLASLRAPDLLKWGVGRDALIGAPPTSYARTALWAKAIHDHFDGIDGLIWTSKLCDPDSAVLLYGDRVAVGDLEVAGVRSGIDASMLDDVRRAGERGGIELTL